MQSRKKRWIRCLAGIPLRGTRTPVWNLTERLENSNSCVRFCTGDISGCLRISCTNNRNGTTGCVLLAYIGWSVLLLRRDEFPLLIVATPTTPLEDRSTIRE